MKLNNFLNKVNSNIQKAQFNVKKNSPLILTVVGVVGLCYTVYEAYNARDGVRAIVEDLEEKRANGEEIDLKNTVLDLAKVTGKTVIAGTLSVSAIIGSYHILTNRVNLLSAALTTAATEHEKFKEYIRNNHPEVLTAPVAGEEQAFASKDDEGEKTRKMVTAYVRDEGRYLEGMWIDSSRQYDDSADGNYWNEAFTTSGENSLDNMLRDRGFLRLSELYQVMDVKDTDENGNPTYNKQVAETVGWTSGDVFYFNIQTIFVKDDNGISKPMLYISWPPVKSLVGSIDYSNARYEYSY
jgi:hypothetical protein